MKRFHSTLCIVLLFLLLTCPISAFGATTYSTVIALGDSLTDNGNYFLGTNTDPRDVYGIKPFTDGPVWVESLSATLGGTLYDIAFGGATTGADNPAAGDENAALMYTGLLTQTNNILPGLGLTPYEDTLFTVWAGGNDFFQGRGALDAVSNILTSLNILVGAGAQSILVNNLPDLGVNKAYYNDVNPFVTTAEASAWSDVFNAELYLSLMAFAAANTSVDIYFFDVASPLEELFIMDNGKVNPVFWNIGFWDDVHPSGMVHGILAGLAYEVLDGPPLGTPVPGSFLLLSAGLVFICRTRRNA